MAKKKRKIQRRLNASEWNQFKNLFDSTKISKKQMGTKRHLINIKTGRDLKIEIEAKWRFQSLNVPKSAAGSNLEQGIHMQLIRKQKVK